MNFKVAARRRLLCIDLENRPLAYWYDGNPTSQITAFGWKWSDERRPRTLLLQPDGTWVDDDDIPFCTTRAYQLFAGELASAGLVFGHNIRRHDLPMLNAWLMRQELPLLQPILTCDTYKDLPKTAGVSRSLENMAAMYGLRGSKVRMTQPDWEQANQLVPAGVDKARRRVAGDVVLQERLRKRLLELGLLRTPRTWAP